MSPICLQTLLHLRSEQKGAKRRVSAMLNRTKGANRSVLEDAKDKYNTAATIDGTCRAEYRVGRARPHTRRMQLRTHSKSGRVGGVLTK